MEFYNIDLKLVERSESMKMYLNDFTNIITYIDKYITDDNIRKKYFKHLINIFFSYFNNINLDIRYKLYNIFRNNNVNFLEIVCIGYKNDIYFIQMSDFNKIYNIKKESFDKDLLDKLQDKLLYRFVEISPTRIIYKSHLYVTLFLYPNILQIFNDIIVNEEDKQGIFGVNISREFNSGAGHYEFLFFEYNKNGKIIVNYFDPWGSRTHLGGRISKTRIDKEIRQEKLVNNIKKYFSSKITELCKIISRSFYNFKELIIQDDNIINELINIGDVPEWIGPQTKSQGSATCAYWTYYVLYLKIRNPQYSIKEIISLLKINYYELEYLNYMIQIILFTIDISRKIKPVNNKYLENIIKLSFIESLNLDYDGNIIQDNEFDYLSNYLNIGYLNNYLNIYNEPINNDYLEELLEYI